MELTSSQNELIQSLNADNPDMYIVWDEKNGIPKHLLNVSILKSGTPEVAAREFLDDIGALFKFDGVKDIYTLNSVQKDHSGFLHVRFRQTYLITKQEVQVEDKQIVVHLDEENHIIGFDANLFTGISAIIIDGPKYSLDEVIPIIEGLDDRNIILDLEKSTLAIKVVSNIPYLVWKITVQNEGNKDTIRAYYLDAHTKTVLGYRQLVHFGNPTLITAVGNGIFSHRVEKVNLKDWGETPSRINFIDKKIIDDFRLGQIVTNGLAITCYSIYFQALQNVTLCNNTIEGDTEIEVDCLTYARKIFEYFLRKHGRLGWGYYQYAGLHIRNINFVVKYTWPRNDTSESQFCAPYDSEYIIYVGSGRGTGNVGVPFCSEDILAHEWTHAILEGELGFSRNGDESNALCEAISDGFACFITRNWMLGLAQGRVKDIKDPSQSGKPQATHYSQLNHVPWAAIPASPTIFEQAFFNSGIINRMTYLLVEDEKTFNGVIIRKGVGFDFAEKWYHDCLNHLVSESTFHDFVCALKMTLDDYVRREVREIDKKKLPTEIFDTFDQYVNRLEYLEHCKSVLLKAAVTVGIMDRTCLCPMFVYPHYNEILKKIIEKIRVLPIDLDG